MTARAVFLIGSRGSGKTSVGRILAERLGAAFIDSDRLIEEESGETIARIFEERGEEAFRDLEESVIGKIAGRARAGDAIVVGTGGGVVLRSRNVDELRGAGLVVWLTADPETLKARILADRRSVRDRPALRGRSAVDEVEAVLGARRGLYRRAAHLEVSTEELDPEAVADLVLRGAREVAPEAFP